MLRVEQRRTVQKCVHKEQVYLPPPTKYSTQRVPSPRTKSVQSLGKQTSIAEIATLGFHSLTLQQFLTIDITPHMLQPSITFSG